MRQLTRDQFQRWAELIAHGGARFPSNLSSKGATELCREVQRHRRDRLVRFIARTIAMEIARSRDQTREDDRNVEMGL